MPRDRDAAAPGAELVTAYVDGIAELSPEERRSVEAAIAGDPVARGAAEASRQLIDELRALPPQGVEPDWAAMARSIHDAVGDRPMPPRWLRWRWVLPAMTCATAAGALLLLWTRPAPELAVERASHLTATRQAATGVRAGDADAHPDAVALWLDGAPVEVELSAAELLGTAGMIDDDDGDAGGVEPGGVALLPAGDLGWVDGLDDAAIDRAERWLDRAPAAGKG